MHAAERLLEVLVGVLVERVQVLADCSREEDRILRDDGKLILEMLMLSINIVPEVARMNWSSRIGSSCKVGCDTAQD